MTYRGVKGAGTYHDRSVKVAIARSLGELAKGRTLDGARATLIDVDLTRYCGLRRVSSVHVCAIWLESHRILTGTDLVALKSEALWRAKQLLDRWVSYASQCRPHGSTLQLRPDLMHGRT